MNWLAIANMLNEELRGHDVAMLAELSIGTGTIKLFDIVEIGSDALDMGMRAGCM